MKSEDLAAALAAIQWDVFETCRGAPKLVPDGLAAIAREVDWVEPFNRLVVATYDANTGGLASISVPCSEVMARLRGSSMPEIRIELDNFIADVSQLVCEIAARGGFPARRPWIPELIVRLQRYVEVVRASGDLDVSGDVGDCASWAVEQVERAQRVFASKSR